MEQPHLKALESCGKDLQDLPNEINTAISSLNQLVDDYNKNPSDSLENSVEM